MSDSDDTDVLLLIPNDFFAVDEHTSQETSDNAALDRRSSNLISFSSMKMSDLGFQKTAEEDPTRPCTDFDQYCADHFESSLSNLPPNEEKNILNEIDSYLHQFQSHHSHQPAMQAPSAFYCPADRSETPSEIPSLKDLWGSEHVPNASSNPGGSTWLEERLHRKQLERNLEMTQMELIKAQQKVAVALSVDQAKDAALNKYRATVKVLQQENSTNEELRKRLDEMGQDVERSERRCRELEVELKASLERSKRLKETNDLLEEKVSHLTTSTNDIREINKKQIEDLQVRLSNSLKAEQLINDDLVRTRNQLVIEKNCHRENNEMWTRKEGNFKAEMETLRASLKHFYQKQLNEVVDEKVKEFQRQMDDLEVTFKMDYLRRERQIAERAIGQMELIFKKNEEEVRLLTEKHQEEIKFVQLQLEMAQTTITEAQQRLGGCGNMHGEENHRTMRVKEEMVQGKSPKKMNNVNEKANTNTTGKRNCELQGYIETMLKKSPKFNSTRINRTKTPLIR